MKRIDARLLVGVGLVVFAASLFHEFVARPGLRRTAALLAQRDPRARSGDCHDADLSNRVGRDRAALGLFNMTRNPGGAIGTAAIETFFTHLGQFHSAIITALIGVVLLTAVLAVAMLRKGAASGGAAH
jgi:DHA2 family multidrug resistance protein